MSTEFNRLLAPARGSGPSRHFGASKSFWKAECERTFRKSSKRPVRMAFHCGLRALGICSKVVMGAERISSREGRPGSSSSSS
jgi:hypothetical protein